MNPLFIIPVVISTTCSGLNLTGPSDTDVAARRAEDDALAADARDPAYVSHEAGFEGAHWGMSEAEVQALYPPARVVSSESVVLPREVDGKPAVIDFGFVRGKLAQVQVTFPPTATEADYDDVARLLFRQLGTATIEHNPRVEELKRLDQQQSFTEASEILGILFLKPMPSVINTVGATANEQRIQAERTLAMITPTRRDARWIRQESRADLTFEPGKAMPLELTYQSRALGWDFEQQQAAEQLAQRAATAMRR